MILIDYKSKTNKDEYNKALQKRLNLRDTIYSMQTKAYSNGNNIVKHFEEKNESLPIWAIFELMTLGEFGFFVTTIKESTRLKISKAFNFRLSDDTKGNLTYRLLDTLRNLRNSIAHNNVIFDIRFKKKQVPKQVKAAVGNDVGLSSVEFSDITDYLILIVFLLKKLNVKKAEMKKLVVNYRRLINELYSKIPVNYYSQIIHSDVNYKLNQLEKYISRKNIV